MTPLEEALEHIVEVLEEHTEHLKAVETAIQQLSANIMNLRTGLLVIKALVSKEEEE